MHRQEQLLALGVFVFCALLLYAVWRWPHLAGY